MLPLFSGLTLFLAVAVHWRSWRGPRPAHRTSQISRTSWPAWLCGSFSGWLKPGSQSLTHRKSVRTIEVTLDRSASPWQAELHRLLHQVVVGDEERGVRGAMGDQGGDGGAAAAAAPPTAPPRGARRAVKKYLAEIKRRIEVAVLSGKVPNYIPPDLRDEEGWCRLATDGLQGKLKDLLRDETGTVRARGVQSGTIPAGYGPTDFNKRDVFYAMAVSKATNLGIDKHRKRDGGGGDGGAKDGGRELSARTHNRLNKERAHYVGAAASYGWTTPLGYGCFAEE